MAPSCSDFVGSTTFDDRLVHDVLGEYGAATSEHLRRYLTPQEPKSYLYDLLADYPRRGGKMLRSALCIAMARATGASLEDALDSAASIELMHNALLVHDDIEDSSDERRGTPTLHALHGIPLAINAGDAMGLLSMRPLKRNLHRLGLATALRIFEETERVAWESAEGQALELGWQRDNRTELGEDDYLRMVAQKTCWLMAIHPLRIGCLIGARGRLPLEPLNQIGFFFGTTFQIRDDLLNLEPGDNYGKEINGDLFEGKRTLMVIHALREADDRDRKRLVRFLGLQRRQRSTAEVGWVRELLDRTGALAHARLFAHSLVGAALYEFDHYVETLPPGRDLQFIRSLLTWVLARTH